MISFVLSNPGHHAEILLPAVEELTRRGKQCQVVSMAELRGMPTPKWPLSRAEVVRVLPAHLRRKKRAAITRASSEKPRFEWRAFAQRALWSVGLGPRMRRLLRGSSAVIIPNDSVFPYRQLISTLKDSNVPVVLVQEGIRFPLPCDDADTAYGRNGATSVCVWGQGSADHFRSIGVPASSLRITGNPRFDSLDIEHWRSEGKRALESLGVSGAPLLFMSNPIEIQGYGSVDLKLQMFRDFLVEARPVVEERGCPIVVKLHSHEEPAGFQRVIDDVGVHATVAKNVSLFGLLATASSAIVIASTVGLEALTFGLPLGALEIPGHGFAFEYVQRGAAVGLSAGTIAAGVEELLTRPHLRRDAGRDLVERYLAHRGEATSRLTDAILAVERHS